MALDRLIPNSGTAGTITGDDFMDAVQEELTGIWDRSCIKLSSIGGTANAITATAAPAMTSGLQDGMRFLLTPGSNNTGPVTLAIGSESAVGVVDKDGNALEADDLVAGRRYPLLYDGDVSKLIVLTEIGDPAAGLIFNVQVFTSSGTYTPTTGATKALVFVTGGGASGGTGQGGASTDIGGSGGGGATAFAYVTSLSSVSVTVGSGGAAVATNRTDGNNGGQSAFGTITANGGNKGTGGDASGNDGSSGAAQSTTANATLTFAGTAGDASGSGGPSSGGTTFWGGPVIQTKNGTTNGAAGTTYGGGGVGAANATSGAGKAGLVLVLEF